MFAVPVEKVPRSHGSALRLFRASYENDSFVLGDEESLAFGTGGGTFTLWMDGLLDVGHSGNASTYCNDGALFGKEDFHIIGLELWGISSSDVSTGA